MAARISPQSRGHSPQRSRSRSFPLAGGELSGRVPDAFRHSSPPPGSRWFLVETMNDARSGDAPDAAQLPGTMVQQGVDEGVFFVARCRMQPPAPVSCSTPRQRFVLI